MLQGFLGELWQSSDSIFQNRLSWLLITGPIAILGQSFLSEAASFTLAGMALIPCAERLSFLTEQVALHTNASIGALLNATFGNAPELLIASAAIRSGFYRLTQLTMLGSMITNMVFVFGLSCFVGGLRWQTQELPSGSAVIAMLLLSTAGSLIPAALVLSGHFLDHDKKLDTTHSRMLDETPSQEEITLSRVNAAVMLTAYLLYLVFQLGTHVNETPERTTMPRPNLVCRKIFTWGVMPIVRGVRKRTSNLEQLVGKTPTSETQLDVDTDEEAVILLKQPNLTRRDEPPVSPLRSSKFVTATTSEHSSNGDPLQIREVPRLLGRKSKESDTAHEEPHLSMRVGIFWLFVVTMCISAMSDILVNTIDGFAQRMRLSQVFTSMVIIPFFSNIAEQVSSVIFGYRNEMALCVGVTIGSAIQIATFVLPGSVLMAMVMDRSMTLYFHSYETVCWFFCTVLVSFILLSKTSNWLVGAILILTYVMFAAGIWYHEIENLSVDAEDLSNDATVGG